MATYHLTIKKEITAQSSGFCTCCGNRYESGATVVVLNEQPTARGRVAHKSCVAKNNTKIEKDMRNNPQGIEA